MARFLKKRDVNIGMAPGSLVFIGTKKTETVQIHLIDYDIETFNEENLGAISKAQEYLKTSDTVTWINVNGIHDAEIIRETGAAFGLHPLILEDIMNSGQRPKLEEYDNCLFIVLKMLRYDSEQERILSEQVSMVLGDKYLLTFQEAPGDVFDPVRDRIRKQKGRIRSMGNDYLAYSLLDIIVDNYIHIVERLGEHIEDMEEDVVSGDDTTVLERINNYQRELNYLRKSIRPAREAVLQLNKLESGIIADNTVPFLKDLLDLITQGTEIVETYREMLSDYLTMYITVVSNKMNDIMKVLTIFAAIFIPLTFIAGIYGTNFDYLPELHYRYSYFIFWGVLILIGLTMLAYFKKRNWL